jgi:hypothetical protein
VKTSSHICNNESSPSPSTDVDITSKHEDRGSSQG